MPPSRTVPPTDSRAGTPSRRTLLAAAAAFGLAPEAVRAQAPAAAPGAPAPSSAQPEPAAAPAALPAAPGRTRFRPEPAPETPVC